MNLQAELEITLTEEGDSPTIIVLSIKPVHAQRIYRGVKRYELRKMLPRRFFKRVYLYETGGRGVTGCFDVGEVFRRHVDELWRLVGSEATSKERFYSYFDGTEIGCAIEVLRPIQFSQPVSPTELENCYPQFTHPQSFLVFAPDHPLHDVLEGKRAVESRSMQRSVRLRPIEQHEHSAFRKLVDAYVGIRYDEIDESFASSILKTHDRGADSYGFLTERKQVFAIVDEDRQIGFTVLTFKLGGSVKTGPTTLFERYQGMGYGQATRDAVEQYVLACGGRKVYCTCPDQSMPVVKYLLKSGYRVEAHLREHYTARNGELVFGKILRSPTTSQVHEWSRSSLAASVVEGKDAGTQAARTSALIDLFSHTWFKLNRGHARQIVRSTQTNRKKSYATKPKYAIWLRSRGRLIGAAVILPKRGGALKCLLLTRTSHTPSLDRLIRTVEEKAGQLGRRKVYWPHPVDDCVGNQLFRDRGYSVEGLLREPYCVGQDVLVHAKILEQ